jgi:2-desacetyl-2-hydroxyethyl bacteriochlorophyllide A dehydrogenase
MGSLSSPGRKYPDLMPNELLLTAPRSLRIVSYDDGVLSSDAVRADAVVSGISHGTELALYRGDSPFGGKRFDLDLRQFVEAAETELYPIRLGYEWVGRIGAVGDDVREIAVGDHVHLTLPHRGTQTVTTDWLVLPEELDPERAALLQSAAIGLQAVHDARLKVGDQVAIFGLGVLGLLAVQLARLNGADWIAAVDPVARRRQLAASFGADCTLDPTSTDAGREIKLAAGRGGPDVAIEFSGRYAALHEALRCVRLAGTVVAAGFYVGGAGSDLRLGEEFHHNHLTLVGSMSGWGAPEREPGWDRRRLRATALDLIAEGRLDVDPFITHRVPFERAAEAYELIDRRPEETLRVVLTY